MPTIIILFWNLSSVYTGHRIMFYFAFEIVASTTTVPPLECVYCFVSMISHRYTVRKCGMDELVSIDFL
jgi:hypothetical protein